MTNSFVRNHKALSLIFVTGVLAIVGVLTVYKISAAPTTWTQTDWSGGQSDNVVIAAADLGNLYKDATPYINVSQSGEISVINITSNSSFDTDINDWSYDTGVGSNLTWEDTIVYSGSGSAQLDSHVDDNPALYQNITITEAGNYILSAYVYYDGQVVDSNIAQLYYNGNPIVTDYAIMGGNWYRLTATVADDASGAKTYGIFKKMLHPEPMYIDDIELHAETNTLTSSIFDMENPQFWGNLSYAANGMGDVTFKVRTGDTADLVDATDFNMCDTLSSFTISSNNCVDDGDRYIQYQIIFNSAYNGGLYLYTTLTSLNLQGNDSLIQFFPNNGNNVESDIVVQIPVALNGALEEDASVDYTITGTATNGTDYALIADGNLTITAGNLNATIDITGLIDDMINEDAETIIVTLSNPVNTSLGANSVYTYTINDNDPEPTVSWTTDTEMVSEDFGAPVTITATLSAPSGKEITVPFDITGTALSAGVDYTLTPETPSPLIIPAGDTTASFTVDFNNEAIYEDDETIIFTIDEGNIINAGVSGIDPTVETVTIVNDDPTPEANFNVIGAAFSEGDGDVQMEVTFSNPSEDDILLNYRIIATDSGMPSDFVINDACNEMDICSVNVPAGDTTARFSITLTDDSITEIAENTTFEILPDPPFMTAGLLNQYTLTINDDDVPGLNISAISGDTTEGGISQTFTIELNTEPDGDVVIDLESSDTSEGTIDLSTVTFNNTNWNIPQTITVTGIDDFLADGDIPYLVNLTIDNEGVIDPEITSDTTGYAALGLEVVNATNLDNDTLAITVTPTALTTHENGSTATFDIVLGSQPDGQVGLNLTNNDPSEGTIDQNTLLFTDLDWNVPQTVTVTGQDDVDQDGDIIYSITIEVNNSIIIPPFTTDTTGYAGLDPDDVSVTNEDDDTPGINVSAISGNTTEAGGTATFTVVLESVPTDDVTVALSSDNTDEGTVSPSSLTFTNADWNTPQTVTVTGVDDNIDDDNQSFQINATISSVDLDYDGMLFVPIDVINEDDDTAGITVSLITGNTTEAGGLANFSIQLDSEPLDDVIIDISSDDATEGSITLASITITPGTWSTPRGITVTGLDDSIVDGDIAYNIILDSAVSLDLNYDGINPDNVTVTNTDNDTIGFTVTQSAGATNVGEGSNTDSYTIRLNTLPSADVVVTLTPNAQVSINPSTLTFTPGNWGNNQTVTVTAVNDTVVEGNHTGTISHSVASTDGDYDEFVIANITANITDNDTAPRTGGGGGGFWFPSANSNPAPTETGTDTNKEERLEKLIELGIPVHALVKIPDDGNTSTTYDNIVYYIGTDGKRHVFPDASVFKTWYSSFRDVRVYPVSTVSQIPLGENVRYKPGVKMIKFTTSNKVYAVAHGGKLRWILNERVAWYMYGTGWQKLIQTVPDSLFVNYQLGDDISHSNQFSFANEAASSQTISMELGL